MYFSKVNRGVSFTKAGFYTTGFVILLGFVASGSGYNGLFLAVGYGLSVLTISGLLSERIMKYYECTGLVETTAEAGQPFGIKLRVKNSSLTWFVFGVENLIVTALPRFKLMPSTIPAQMESRLLMLPPGGSLEISGKCSGLPRGVHRRFFIIQRTLFPFGLLNKFKVSPASSKISVIPGFNEPLARKLALETREKLQGNFADQDFHSHRAMTPRDSPRLIDWKKSAGLQPRDWTIKIYEAPAREFGIAVEVDWQAVAQSGTPEDYERHLSAARTACDVVRNTGRRLILSAPGGGVYTAYDSCVEALAAAPDFAAKNTLMGLLVGREPEPGWFLRLHITKDSFFWEDSAIFWGRSA